MSSYKQYKLKDGRKIRSRNSSDSSKVIIPRDNFEELLYEADVAYEQAKQLQTIIENLQEIKAEAVTKALDKIRTEIEQVEINGYIRDVECYRAGLNTAVKIIDKYKRNEE